MQMFERFVDVVTLIMCVVRNIKNVYNTKRY